MIDWMQLLIQYWWVLAIVVTAVLVVMRVSQFFNFFTALVMLLGILYAATIVFFPPSDAIPTKNISQVLGVKSETDESSNSAENGQNSEVNCIQQIEEGESFSNCAEDWRKGIKMPDFKKLIEGQIEIKYE